MKGLIGKAYIKILTVISISIAAHTVQVSVAKEIDAASFQHGLQLGRFQQICRTYELKRIDSAGAKMLMIDAYSELGGVDQASVKAIFQTAREMYPSCKNILGDP